MDQIALYKGFKVAEILRKAGWQCEVRAGDKDPGVHFTVYRGQEKNLS